MANETPNPAQEKGEVRLTGTSFRREAREAASTDQYRWYTEYFQASPDNKLVILDQLADMYQEAIQKARGIRDHDDPEIGDKKDKLKEKLDQIHAKSKALKRNEDAEGVGSRAGSFNVPLILPDLRKTPDALFDFLVNFDMDELGTNPVVMHSREALDDLQEWIGGKNVGSIQAAVERLFEAGCRPDDLIGANLEKQIQAARALVSTGKEGDAEVADHIALALRDPFHSEYSGLTESLRTIAKLLNEPYEKFHGYARERELISADSKEGLMDAAQNYIAKHPKLGLAGLGALIYGAYKVASNSEKGKSLLESGWTWAAVGGAIFGSGVLREYSGATIDDLVPGASDARIPTKEQRDNAYYQLFANFLPENSGTQVTSMMHLGMVDATQALSVFESAYNNVPYNKKLDPAEIARLSDKLSFDEAEKVSPLVAQALQGVLEKIAGKARAAHWPEVKNYTDDVKLGLAYYNATLKKHDLTLISLATICNNPAEILNEMLFESSLVDGLDTPFELNETDRQTASTLARLYRMKGGFDKAPVIPQGNGEFLIHGYLYRCYKDEEGKLQVRDAFGTQKRFPIDPTELKVEKLDAIIANSTAKMTERFTAPAGSSATLDFDKTLGRWKVNGLTADNYNGLTLSNQPIQALLVPEGVSGVHYRMLNHEGKGYANSTHYSELTKLQEEYGEQVLLGEVLKTQFGLSSVLGGLDFEVKDAVNSASTSNETVVTIGYGKDHVTEGKLTFAGNKLTAIKLNPDLTLNRAWEAEAKSKSAIYFEGVRNRSNPSEENLKSALDGLQGDGLERVMFEGGALIQRVFGSVNPKNPKFFDGEAWLRDSVWATYERMQAQSAAEIRTLIEQAATSPDPAISPDPALDRKIKDVLDKNMKIVQDSFSQVADKIKTDVKSASDQVEAGKISADVTNYAYETLESVGIQDKTYQQFWEDLDPLMTASGFDWIGGDGMQNARRARMAFQNTLMDLSWPLPFAMPTAPADNKIAMQYLNYLYSLAEWTLKNSQKNESGDFKILDVTIDHRIGDLNAALRARGALNFAEFSEKIKNGDPALTGISDKMWTKYATPPGVSLSDFPAYLHDKIAAYAPNVVSFLPAFGTEKPKVDPAAKIDLGSDRYNAFLKYADLEIKSRFDRIDPVAMDALHPEHEKLRERRIGVFEAGMRQEIADAKTSSGSLTEGALDDIIQKYLRWASLETQGHDRLLQSPLDSIALMMQDMLVYPNSHHDGEVLRPESLSGSRSRYKTLTGDRGADWLKPVGVLTRYLPTQFKDWNGKYGISEPSMNSEIDMMYLDNIDYGSFNATSLAGYGRATATPENYTAFYLTELERIYEETNHDAKAAKPKIEKIPNYLKWANMQFDPSTNTIIKVASMSSPVVTPNPYGLDSSPANRDSIDKAKEALVIDWAKKLDEKLKKVIVVKSNGTLKNTADVKGLPKMFEDFIAQRAAQILIQSQGTSDLTLGLQALESASLTEASTLISLKPNDNELYFIDQPFYRLPTVGTVGGAVVGAGVGTLGGPPGMAIGGGVGALLGYGAGALAKHNSYDPDELFKESDLKGKFWKWYNAGQSKRNIADYQETLRDVVDDLSWL